MLHSTSMRKTIAQRQLRNDFSSVLREVQAGQTLVVTRNGVPVAELRPVPPRRFVARAAIAAATWDALPFDAEAARAYGRVFAATRAVGRPGRTCLADLLFAATAAANNLPLYTRNPADFSGLDGIVTVIRV